MLLLLSIGCVRTAPDGADKADHGDTARPDTAPDTGVPDTDETADTDTGGSDTDTDTGGHDTWAGDPTPVVCPGEEAEQVPLLDVDAPDVTVETTTSTGTPARSMAGDLDGDAVPDLVISLPSWGTYGGACIAHGLVPGLSIDLDACGDTIVGTTGGLSVRGIFDANGDGVDDALVWELGSDDEGVVGIVEGPISGTTTLADAALVVAGEPRHLFGCCYPVAGDVDGDGSAELLFRDLDDSVGSVAEVPLGWTGEHGTEEVESWIRPPGDTSAGISEAAVADVDGDGQDDVWLFNSDDDGYAGRIYLLHGPLASGTTTERDADVTLRGEASDAVPGDPVVADLDNDGYPEVAFNSFESACADRDGAVYVLSGPSIPSGGFRAAAAMTIRGDEGHEEVGVDLAAGDGDGDGVDELLVLRERDAQLSSDVFRFRGITEGSVGVGDGELVLAGGVREGLGTMTAIDLDGVSTDDLVLTRGSADDVVIYLGGWE